MNPRFLANINIGARKPLESSDARVKTSDVFAMHVFDSQVIQKMLPEAICKNLLDAMNGLGAVTPDHLPAIANAIKEWALSLGVSHYCHWFQPLNGGAAEKHDGFLTWHTDDQVIEKFSGNQLLQGEPDASSFPSGGLRATHEARGYTGWDATTAVFVIERGDGKTLYIPTIYFSWNGEALDTKIPMLRSEQKINDASLRLMKLTGIPGKLVYSTLGIEQEYFVVDRYFSNLRPDLTLCGRTVFGSAPPKGQELQDHYLGPVKDRILAYMRDFELEAYKLGIPLKTRHNEVAPSQHEVAPIYERSSRAIDHNIILMELMKQVAIKHGLTCLLHEKPFNALNGSGKHCNWALGTDSGINLLDPTDTPENTLHFLILVTAVLNAVHRHSALLRASIGSAANDYRLGGHEAPPAIISVYLGKELDTVLTDIEKAGVYKRTLTDKDLKLQLLKFLHLKRDTTDRNRSSPFAFTGNKFEFRAVGSSSSPAFPITTLNAIVAESLNEILDEIESKAGNDLSFKTALPIIQKYLKASKSVRFDGDNYSVEWEKEAKRRNLPNLKKAIEAFDTLLDKKTIKVFEGILTTQELSSRYEIFHEAYFFSLNIEVKLMIDIFRSHILPVAVKHLENMSNSLLAYTSATGEKKPLPEQQSNIKLLGSLIEKSTILAREIEVARTKATSLDVLKRSKVFCEKVIPLSNELRLIVDQIETIVDDNIWPLPKYRELLFVN